MMVVVMDERATLGEISRVLKTAEELGLTPHITRDGQRTSVGVVADPAATVDREAFETLPGVAEITGLTKPFKLASREFNPADSVVYVRDAAIGGARLAIIAGPCAVESRAQTLEAARIAAAAGAVILRGGAYKPRSSPYSFQGLAEEGLSILAAAREQYGLPVVTEVVAPELVDTVAASADMLQVGARNMQNFALLEAVGRAKKPVLLKRGMMASIEELLMSAEYILAGGNRQVVLCERGIRTFETYTRNTLDISAVPALKQLTHLPVIVDPSHATGRRELVLAASRAAIAAGADGLIIEMHPCPDDALCDGKQSITPQQLSELMAQLKLVGAAVGRTL